MNVYKKMVWILTNNRNKRLKLKNGVLTPVFNYPYKAIDYAENKGMKYYKCIKV